MSNLIDRQKVLNTLDFADNALTDEDRTVENYKKLLTECIKALPSVENKGEWIPVSERLPEYGKAVLTYHEDDEEYQINWVADDETGEWCYENPIAWQPLPEPYKADREVSKWKYTN